MVVTSVTFVHVVEIKPNNPKNGAKLRRPVSIEDHVQGLESAPVTLVEYADFECPHCLGAYWMLKEVTAWLGNDLRYVFRHFPASDVHPHAQAAAEASEAAADDGKFWQMHDVLYEHLPMLDAPSLASHAASIGLEVGKFTRQMAERAFANRVRSDVESGVESGVSNIPTFFINGVRHDGGYDIDTLLEAIEEAGVSIRTD